MIHFLISFFYIPGNENYAVLNDIKTIQNHGWYTES